MVRTVWLFLVIAASGASDQYHDWKSPAAVCTGALESADRRPVMRGGRLMQRGKFVSQNGMKITGKEKEDDQKYRIRYGKSPFGL